MKRSEKKFIFFLIIYLLIIIFPINYSFNFSKLSSNIQNLLNNTWVSALEKTNDLETLISNGNLIGDNELTSLEDSGITGEEYTFDTKYYPYYGFLTPNEQILYKQIYANIYSLASVFRPTVTVMSTEVTNAMEAVYNDHPELFWLNTSYSYKYTKNKNVVQIILSFNETATDINATKMKFYTSANKIIRSAKKLNTNYKKEKYVHDAIIELSNYNLNADMNQSAYSALVNGNTVCAGYARAFQYIMIELGIPTYYVTGDSKGDHAWNIVLLSDGYYNVDLTWDDTNPISYTYFNLTDSDFSQTHTRTGSSLSLPSCTGTIYRKLETNSSNPEKKKTSTNSNQSDKLNQSSNNSSTNDYSSNNNTNSNNNFNETNTNSSSNQEIEDTTSSSNNQMNTNENDSVKNKSPNEDPTNELNNSDNQATSNNQSTSTDIP